jgi:hypothetical protein
MTYDFRTARLRSTKMMPYLTKGIMSTIPIEKPGIGTMATDCYLRIYYDPKVLTEWTLDECSAVILHEILHAVYRHDVRAKARLGEKPSEDLRVMWNIAADISINDTLQEAGITLPKGCMNSKLFGFPPKLSTEEYYDLVLKLPKQKVPSDLRGEGSGESSGSLSDGVPREWEAGKPGKESGQDGQDGAPHGLGAYERKRLERVIATDVAEASRKQGKVPGGLARIANEILKPAFDPRREIMAEVKYSLNAVSGFGSSTWILPGRRSPPGGLRLPKSICPVPKPVLIFDTSGSMNDTDLALCRGVLADVFRALPSQEGVRVITGDTHIESCQRAFSQAHVELVGGGGTDMARLMEEAATKYPDAHVIVVVSDGYTPWPSKPLRQKCLVLLTQRSQKDSVPSWIRTVCIRPEEN